MGKVIKANFNKSAQAEPIREPIDLSYEQIERLKRLRASIARIQTLVGELQKMMPPKRDDSGRY